ncbi:MAG: hypothetical protein WC807_14560 [Hyphomicrobium sp.]|jgi:hypothetical protein
MLGSQYLLPPAGGSGSLIRVWTPHRLRAAIDAANAGIRNALHAGDMDMALILISRKVGLRVCAGDINIRLKKPLFVTEKRPTPQRPHAA